MMSIIIRFEKAAEEVPKLLSKLSNEEMLKLYGLYKQATEGDNELERPWSFQLKASAKWEAWNREKGKKPFECKSEYIGLVYEYKKKILNIK